MLLREIIIKGLALVNRVLISLEYSGTYSGHKFDDLFESDNRRLILLNNALLLDLHFHIHILDPFDFILMHGDLIVDEQFVLIIP